LEETSWRRPPGGGILEEGGSTKEHPGGTWETSGRHRGGHHGKGIMEEASWRKEASWRSILKAPWKHMARITGNIWEAPGGLKSCNGVQKLSGDRGVARVSAHKMCTALDRFAFFTRV